LRFGRYHFSSVEILIYICNYRCNDCIKKKGKKKAFRDQSNPKGNKLMLKAIVSTALSLACGITVMSAKNLPLLALEGVPNIPWCRVGETPRTHKCRNGSESGGLYLADKASESEKDSRGDSRGEKRPPSNSKSNKKDEPKCYYDDGREAPCFDAPDDTKGGSTR
jgi:hypothetical protein